MASSSFCCISSGIFQLTQTCFSCLNRIQSFLPSSSSIDEGTRPLDCSNTEDASTADLNTVILYQLITQERHGEMSHGRVSCVSNPYECTFLHLNNIQTDCRQATIGWIGQYDGMMSESNGQINFHRHLFFIKWPIGL